MIPIWYSRTQLPSINFVPIFYGLANFEKAYCNNPRLLESNDFWHKWKQGFTNQIIKQNIKQEHFYPLLTDRQKLELLNQDCDILELKDQIFPVYVLHVAKRSCASQNNSEVIINPEGMKFPRLHFFENVYFQNPEILLNLVFMRVWGYIYHLQNKIQPQVYSLNPKYLEDVVTNLHKNKIFLEYIMDVNKRKKTRAK